jgi:hypothetical protein
MKYIISESRLESAMNKVFHQYINPDEIDYYHPSEQSDDGVHYDDTNRMVYYVGDDMYDGDEVFRYYECDYFDGDAVEAQENCPALSLHQNIKETFDGLFGEYWVEPFKKWVNINLGLYPKTVDYL